METKQLEVLVTANTSQFKEKMAGLNSTASESSGLFGKLAGSFVVAQLASEAITKGVEYLTDSLKEANKVNDSIQASQAQINQLLKNTGDVSGQTSESINKMAEELSKVAPISKEANLQAAAMLLPFQQIHKDAFPKVMQAADDLATHMNHGLAPSADQVSTAAKQLGIAMEDPATGMGKLRKAGVVLDAQQQALIKTTEKTQGVQAAQNVLLNILSKTMGGSATAAAGTFNGKMTMLKNGFVEFEASGIQKVKEGLNTLAGNINNFINSDKFQAFWKQFLATLSQVWNFLYATFAPVFKQLAQVYETQVFPAIQHLIQALSPGLLEALKIIAVIVGGALVISLRIWIEVMIIAAKVTADLIQWISNAINWIVGFVNAINNGARAIGNFANSVYNSVVNALAGVGGWLYQAGRNLIQGFINGIENMIGGVGNAVGNVASSAVNKVKNLLGIHSPSTVFMDIGINMGQGLVNGIASMQAAAQQATSDLAKSTMTGIGNSTTNNNQSIAVNVSTGNFYGQPATAGVDLGTSLANQLRLASRGF